MGPLWRVGLLQGLITTNPHRTWLHFQREINRLAAQKPDLIVMPEMWLGAPSHRSEVPFWLDLYSRRLQDLKKLARECRTAFYFSQLEKAGTRFYNTAYWIDASGSVVGRYRKIHLFSYGGECAIYTAGKRASLFETPWGKIGGLICYDIRFPELARALAHHGAQVFVVCAQWPDSREHHWLTLLKARAIENQVYVIAVNRLGKKGKLNFKGRSVVIDPWGQVVADLKNGPSRVVTMDLSRVDSIRKEFPFFAERTSLPFLKSKPNIGRKGNS